MARRHSLAASLFAWLAPFAAASGANKLPPLVHPDTLPTAIERWSLPATVAQRLDAWDAPRLVRVDDVVYVQDMASSQLVAVDAQTGRSRWFTTLGEGKASRVSFTPYFLDSRLFVGAPGRLFYLHTRDGDVRWAVPVRGQPSGVAVRVADLLFFATEGDEAAASAGVGGRPTATGDAGVGIYALGTRAGRMLWRRTLSGATPRLAADEARIYLTMAGGEVMALLPENGDPLWRQALGANTTWPLVAQGKLHVAVAGPSPRVMALGAADGKTAWETALPAAPVEAVLAGERIVVALEDGSVAAVKLADGALAWRTQVPLDGKVLRAALCTDANRAYLHLSPSEGRTRLAQIDLGSGALVSAINGVSATAVYATVRDNAMLLDTSDGVLRSVRLDKTQKPRRATVTAREYAEELAPRAAKVGDDREALSLVDKFQRLGGAALTVLTGMLQAEEPHVVAIAASALGRLADPRALPALRNALRKQREAASGGTGGLLDPVGALVRAIGVTGGADVVPTLRQILVDASVAHDTRRQAWVALGRVGTPEALAALAELRASAPSGARAFDPLPITVRASTPVGEDNDPEVWRDELRGQTSLAVPDPKGGQVVVSLSPMLGGYNDVWMWRSPDGQSRPKPLFTGVTFAQRGPANFVTLERMDLASSGPTLRVSSPGDEQAFTVRLNWVELEADGDKDGLTNRVERRLGTDETKSDTDGDTVVDGEDGNPLAPARVELTDKQKILRETFFTYFAFFRRRGLVVVDRGVDDPLEYPGRRDVVLTMRRESIRKLQSEVGLHAIDYVGFGGPFASAARRDEAAATEIHIEGGEARVGFDVFRGGESGAGYNVTLRKVGADWIVTAFDEAWRL